MPASTPPGLASIGAESFVRPIRDGEPDAKTEGEKTENVFEKAPYELEALGPERVKARTPPPDVGGRLRETERGFRPKTQIFNFTYLINSLTQMVCHCIIDSGSTPEMRWRQCWIS